MKAPRGLDKALFAKLATCDWIARRQDLLITGKTGTGTGVRLCARRTSWAVPSKTSLPVRTRYMMQPSA